MSINDPQWGNSHRPENDDPDQAPEKTGADSVQPDDRKAASETSDQAPQQPVGNNGTKPPMPPEGPPDLEVLWQQLIHGMRCKVASILRRPPPELLLTSKLVASNPAADAEAPLNWQKLSIRSWLIGIILLFGSWLMSGTYLVDASQQGVLSRFGVIVGTKEPGWHWRLPYPFESVRLVNVVGDRTLDIGSDQNQGRNFAEMLTADQNFVDVSYSVVYQVKDPVAYLSHLEGSADTIGDIVQTALRKAIASQPVASVQEATNEGFVQPTLSNALDAALLEVQSSLDAIRSGLVVKSIQLKSVSMPSPVAQAVKQSDQEVQDKIRALRQAQTNAGDSLVKAYQLVARLDQESDSYAQALNLAADKFNAVNPKPTEQDALNQVSLLNTNLRQKLPLVFSNYSELVGQTQIVEPSKINSKLENRTSINSSSSEWRNPDLMRSRDRVDRPGSGS